MKTSETLQKLAESLANTVGNHVVRKLLLELVEEVVNLELERDDAIEDEQRLRDIFEESGGL